MDPLHHQPDERIHEREAKKISDAIDRQIKADREEIEKNSRGTKLLLLGSSESGKTTVLKQLKIIHGRGLSKERLHYKKIVYLNVVTAIKAIASVASGRPSEEDLLNEPDSPLQNTFTLTRPTNFQLEKASNQPHLDKIADMSIIRGSLNRNSIVIQAESRDLEDDDTNLAYTAPTTTARQQSIDEAAGMFYQLAHGIRCLWKDRAIRSLVDQGYVPTLQDSARYFLDNIDRLASNDYLPTDEDILQARVRTVGVTEHCFDINRVTYRIYDVGGHRSQRQFWAPYFDDVNAIIFMVAISAYDQYLEEAPKVNRMDDALQLFDSICNHRLFSHTSIILFLNKIDVLRRKISRGTSPVARYFSDYRSTRPDGKDDFQSVTKFFQRKFFERNRAGSDSKHIYVHFTHATDTKQMRVITASVSDIVSRMNLKASGLL